MFDKLDDLLIRFEKIVVTKSVTMQSSVQIVEQK